MSTVRIRGDDRVMARTFLMPRRLATSVSVVFGAEPDPVLITESFTSDKGKVLGVRAYSASIQQLMQMAAHGDL